MMVVTMCKNEEERLLYHEYKQIQENDNISDGSDDSDQSDCDKLNLRDLIGFLLAMFTAFW